MLYTGLMLLLSDDEESSSGDENEQPSHRPREARRERAFTKRTPRYHGADGHERWYGKWGSGFWSQYVDRENVERNALVRREFQERFRIPHALFCDIHDEMEEKGLFRKRTRSKSVPSRILLLASFKRIASGAHWTTISELAFVSDRTLRDFFTDKFLPFFSNDEFYSKHVYYPKTIEELQKIERGYRALGLPGCIGSVDAVHMPWDSSPAVLNHLFYNGRKGAATYASVATVDDQCIILYASDADHGASNDKSLIRDNEFHEKIKVDPLYTEFPYELLNADGELKESKGAYTICDGGFNTHCTWIATIHTPNNFESGWAARLESVRKDVERTFGQLKKRFQILRVPSNVSDFAQINRTWRTCCVLHNMLTRRRIACDLGEREARVQSGNFEDQDQAVIQAWEERDKEDAEFYAERLRQRGREVPIQVQDTTMELRLQRARIAQRTSVPRNAVPLSDLRDYHDRQKALITHYNSLLARGGVEPLAPARRRVLRSEVGAFVHHRG